MPRVTVEFFGVPRMRAGRAGVEVEAGTVADALIRSLEEVPGLAGIVSPGGQVGSAYRVCRNGEIFLGEQTQSLDEGDSLMLIAADAGG